MSKITNRETALGDDASIERRLARLLDTPLLARVVPHLPPDTLHQLIRHRGLEACGEIVTAATPAQLTVLLDLDLWDHARPGRDDRFDVDRFGEWIEVLVDSSASAAARTVAALDTNLVVAGLSRYVRVFDPGIFEPTAQSDDEPIDFHEAMREGDAMYGDRAAPPDSIGGRLECEVGGYIVRARRTDAWDAIVELLCALEEEHGHEFHTVMQGCRRLSNSRPEIDGLDDLLRAPEQQLHEVTIEREHRRSQQGYATPADARAFLEMARQPTRARGASAAGPVEANPIVTAYFREISNQQSGISNQQPAEDRSLESIIELLAEAGMVPERPRALLGAGDAGPHAARLAALRQLMDHVRETDETAYLARGRELAFLANTLLAGCSVQSRSFTPPEASDAAAAICNLGLEQWPARWPGESTTRSRDVLPIDLDLVAAFEVGWSMLHQDVSLFAADQLIATLTDLHVVDRDMRLELVALKRILVKERAAGTPWRARGAADILAMFDVAASIGVLGLLDECPVLPEALTAVLEGRTTAVSATGFAFISTAAQVGEVRMFMRRLPGLLAR